jgi:hypothetical protein
MCKFKHVREIEKLRFSKPKEFWKFFINKSNVKHNLSLDDFFKYFSELGNDIFQTTDEESEYFFKYA